MRKLMWTLAFFACSPMVLSGTVQASALKTAFERCRSEYKQTVNDCRDNHADARPTCKDKRRKQLKQCKILRSALRCKRKRISKRQRIRCRALRKAAKRRCNGSTKDRATCKLERNVCQQSCFRKCKACTIRSVLPCVTKCKLAYRVCIGKDSDSARRCSRRAIHRERTCKRRVMYVSFRKQFDCLYNRTISYLRCQNKAYDQERTCYYANSDNLRNCLRNGLSAYKVCRSKARADHGK